MDTDNFIINLKTTFPINKHVNIWDWCSLLELEELGRFINLTRPIFIGNRNSNPSFAVRRPLENYLYEDIYITNNHEDALSLLTHLRNYPWNGTCNIVVADPPGVWGIVKRTHEMEVIIGAYPQRITALKVASDISLTQQCITAVKNLSDKSSMKLVVFENGRFIQD